MQAPAPLQAMLQELLLLAHMLQLLWAMTILPCAMLKRVAFVSANDAQLKKGTMLRAMTNLITNPRSQKQAGPKSLQLSISGAGIHHRAGLVGARKEKRLVASHGPKRNRLECP
jgi:hypothetical protein